MKNMKKMLFAALVTFGLTLACGQAAFAIPALQLDIEGGTYDSGTQTIVSTGPSFTLYAYLNPNIFNTAADTYFISAALAPSVAPGIHSLGSFDFDGAAVDVTADMTYGVPPLENYIVLQGWDQHDLSKHDIFPTYFSEFSFQFDTNNAITPYNTQDRAISGDTINLTPYVPPSHCHGAECVGMYRASFTVDTSLLDPDYAIHFDLYNTKLKSGYDVDVTSFAPFSHDAESGHQSVPEPATLALLGVGVAGVIASRRYFRSK